MNYATHIYLFKISRVTADERLVDRWHTFIFFNLFEYNLMNNTLYAVLIHFHMRSLSTKVINNYSCVHYIMAYNTFFCTSFPAKLSFSGGRTNCDAVACPVVPHFS